MQKLFCRDNQGQDNRHQARRWSTLEKYLLPSFLLFAEIIFFIIYAVLVEYDEGGLPGHEYEVALSLANTSDGINFQRAQDYLLHLQSTRSTTKVYSRE